MAKIVITVLDSNGGVDMQAHFEPEIKGEMTGAQYLATAMLDGAKKAMQNAGAQVRQDTYSEGEIN